ncbi:MAG TPA: dihydropteroate synthase [Chitinophagaceae bacterium]|nr:dihydropteroate synthase [Chitinophagaceae bacterium]
MFTLNCKGKLLVIEKPLVMGIINATPDSFYKGSRFSGAGNILEQAEKMLNEGAAILDIGGQSSRPGSEKIPVEEEMKRVIPAIEAIRKKHPTVLISIDTFYARCAAEAIEAGANIVNDISAGEMDSNMFQTVSALQVPYILMHMKGTPETMQQDPVYEDIVKEILDFFIKKISELKAAGIRDIIIDVGFGFGKTKAHNFELLKNLSVFKMLEKPILLGVSRKSSIYKTLGISQDEALNGTTVLNTIGLMNGASILRVHDVKEAHEAITLYTAMGK